jgi:dTDP-4-amino-4,6-dideoxygalactose transaminase
VPEKLSFSEPSITRAEIDAVVRVLTSRWLTTGNECEAFEGELADRLGAPAVVAMSSCTAALETSLAYLGLPSGARVGVPTWTFASTGLAAHRVGAIPVLLDIDPRDLNLSCESLVAAIHQLDAVIPVHFAGVPVRRELWAICDDAGVPIVEDAAHALGAAWGRQSVNGLGSVGACFSFYATKNVSAGEGGALATFDKGLAEFARLYRLHGLSKDAWRRYEVGAEITYDVKLPGIKANLPDLLAAIGRVQLSRFDEMQAKRASLVLQYRTLLSQAAAVTPVPLEGAGDSANHLMVVLLPEGADRSQITRSMAAEGIGTSVHFRPLHQMSWFAEHAAIGPSGVRAAEAVSDRVLSLPLHAEMTTASVDRVCEALAKALV